MMILYGIVTIEQLEKEMKAREALYSEEEFARKVGRILRKIRRASA